MQRRHKAKGYPKGRKHSSMRPPKGNYTLLGWGYHPTKGFRKL